jgi:hypothetical protein
MRRHQFGKEYVRRLSERYRVVICADRRPVTALTCRGPHQTLCDSLDRLRLLTALAVELVGLIAHEHIGIVHT